MVFPSNRSPLNRRLTSRKILRSALISLLPRPLLARDWPPSLSLRAKSNRGSPFYEAKVSRMNHVIRSLMTRSQMFGDPLPRSCWKSRRGPFEFSPKPVVRENRRSGGLYRKVVGISSVVRLSLPA